MKEFAIAKACSSPYLVYGNSFKECTQRNAAMVTNSPWGVLILYISDMSGFVLITISLLFKSILFKFVLVVHADIMHASMLKYIIFIMRDL